MNLKVRRRNSVNNQKPNDKPLIYAFVFARGGSKGLPGKNLRRLGGHSLVARAIMTALQSKLVDEVIVSTDSESIAREAERYGGLVPALRPAELAGDRSSEWLAWRHAIEHLSPRAPDIFVSVPPVAPLRISRDIDACVEELQRSDAELVLTVCQANRNPYFNQIRVEPDGRIAVAIETTNVVRRQDAPPVFDITTVAYAATPDAILKRSGVFDCCLSYVEVPVERAIDIDTPLDFEIAEFLDARMRMKRLAA